MVFSPSLTPGKRAALPIDFLIIGGGIAGLACAIALRRVGHRVLVLERHDSVYKATGGCRMPPNLSKILFHWGLADEVRKIGLKSQGIGLHLLHSGELLGTHIWDEEMLRETRGEFIFAHHAELRKLLYDTALFCGATVRMGSTVAALDPTTRRVRLTSGEVLRADVIIGADGSTGITRKLMEEDDSEPIHRVNMYSTTVPKELMMRDKELASMYNRDLTGMFGWFGNGKCTLAFPVGGKPELAMYVYGPKDGHEGTWDDQAPLGAMQQVLATSESRLRKLGKLAAPPVCVPIVEYPELEDWVHESGRLLLIGEAAHPLPPGGIQEAAMAVEDGAVLAKLFSHLRTDDQITNFLYAFQDLRQPRCKRVLQKELGDLGFMTLPPGDYQQQRDSVMRSKRDAGKDVLDASEGMEESAEWAEIKDVFGYDAEDDADNWWMEWGLLRERARGTDVSWGFVQPVAIQHGHMSLAPLQVV